MKKLSVVLLALVMVWGLSGGAGAQGQISSEPKSPPKYGTVNGNIWTLIINLPRHSYTETITPVPSWYEKDDQYVLVLSPGSTFTLSGKGVGYKIYTIIEWDDSGLGEHIVASSSIFSGSSGQSYTFKNPGLFSMHCIDTKTNKPVSMFDIEVSSAAALGKKQ